MSVRLWWKFSPNLMTPVPMIATFPPSPIAASLAPPSLPEPGATSNPARRARRPARAQPGLQEAAEERLLGETGEGAAPADGEPEQGRGSAGERPADRLERAARFEPEDEGQRVERLAEREHAERHHRHCPA